MARHGHRIEAVAGGLLCFGGFSPNPDERGTKETWWLAPSATAWQRRADMHCGRAFHSSTLHGGKVWAIGDGIASYDLATDQWQEWLPRGSLPRSHFGAARVGPIVYVLGGEAQKRGKMYSIDLRQPRIDEVDAPPGAKGGDHFALLAELDGVLHVIGGVDRDVEPLRRHFVLESSGWRRLPTPPDWLWAKFACQARIGRQFYVLSSFGSHSFDVTSAQWHTLPKMPKALVLPQAVVANGHIHVLGGQSSEQGCGPVHLSYDPITASWHDHATSSHVR